MKFSSNLLSLLSVKEHYYLMILYYLGCTVSTKSLKTLTIFFSPMIQQSTYFYAKVEGMTAYLKDHQYELFTYFLLKSSCPSQ